MEELTKLVVGHVQAAGESIAANRWYRAAYKGGSLAIEVQSVELSGEPYPAESHIFVETTRVDMPWSVNTPKKNGDDSLTGGILIVARNVSLRQALYDELSELRYAFEPTRVSYGLVVIPQPPTDTPR